MEPAPRGSDRGSLVTQYAYDSQDRTLQAVTLDDGRIYSFDFNGAGMPILAQTPDGRQWTATYGGSPAIKLTGGSAPGYASLGTVQYGTGAAQYLPLSYTDLNNKVWSATYNAFGQTTSATAPGEAGAPSIVSNFDYYNTENNSAYKGWAKSAWDSLGTLGVIDSYDVLGDPTSVKTTPNNGTLWHTCLFEWDAAQRLTKATRPDGLFTTLNYTGDQLSSVVGVDGTTLTLSYCARCGLLIGVAGPTIAGQGQWKLGVTRNSDHQVTAFTDARNYNTTYQYGQAGELKSVTLPDNSSASFWYDGVGRVSSVQTGTSSLSLNYDDADRVTSLSATKNAATQTVAYNYKTDDSLNYVTDPTGRTDVSYNTDGSVNSVFTTLTGLNSGGQPLIQKLTYAYYANGARKSLTWTQGNAGIGGAFPTTVASWNYTYDVRGRLTQVVASLPGNATETTTYGYDNEDKLTSINNQNGTSTTFGYTTLQNFVSNLTHQKNGSTFAAFGLTYDGGNNTVGNVTGIAETGTGATSTTTYSYDALYRLTGETRTGTGAILQTFGYDLAGNRLSVNGQSSTFDAANKISTLPSGQSVQYDADGNQTRWAISTGTDYFDYTYDAWGHLTRNQWQGAYPSGFPADYQFAYDAFGRRVKRTWTSNSQAQTRFFVFDGDTLLGEITNGAVSSVFTWGAAGLVSKREWTGSFWQSGWYQFGASGETRRVTDAGGNVSASYTYDAWGNLLTSSGGGVGATPFLFGGQVGYYDDGSGLFLCGLRWYNPKLGRWLTRDPIGYAGGANLYDYCFNNPITYFDPSGTDRQGTIWQYIFSRDYLSDVGDVFKGYGKGVYNLAADTLNVSTTATYYQATGPLQLLSGIYIPPPQLPTFEAANANEGFGMIYVNVASIVISLTSGAGEARAISGIVCRTGNGATSEVASMTVVRTIKKKESLEAIINELKQLTYQHDVEHAVVVLANGERAIVSGGRLGISFPAGSIKRIIGHTHPYSGLPSGPSQGDIDALRQLGQRSSRLLERGTIQKFYRK